MQDATIQQATERLGDGLAHARKLGAQAARARFSRRERVGCEFENGRLKSSDTRQSSAFDIEVLVDGRRAEASGNDLADVENVAGQAVALAQAGSAAHFSAYPPPAEVVEVKTYSPRTAGLPRRKMIDACQNMVDQLKAYNPELFIAAAAIRSEGQSVLVTSGGVVRQDSGTGWSLAAHVQRTEGTDMLFAGFGRHGVDLDEQWDGDLIVRRTIEDLRHGRTIAEPLGGKVTAFLPPEMLRRLLVALELGINGRNVAKGDSPLRGRLGQRILDESLTITDDPHTDFVPGARAVDNSGVPTRVVPIISDGVLTNFLYDLDSAGLAGAEPTGNDGCRPYSLTVRPGELPSEQLLAGIEDGIVIKNVLGFGQGNLINGDFSCNVALGFRVRDGRIVGRLKDTMVAGNFYDLFARNVRLSSDVDPVFRVPYAVIEGVSLNAARG